MAQMGDESLLRGLVQSLFHHVDHHDISACGFQSDKKGNQSRRGGGAVFNQPGQGLIDSGLERRVGIELCARRCA